MISAQEDCDWLVGTAVISRIGALILATDRHVGDALDVGTGLDIEELCDVGDGGLAGRRDQLWHAVARCGHFFDGREARGGFFEIGGVAAGGTAGDEVFARIAVDHELLRLGAAHRSGVRFDDDEVQSGAGEDGSIGSIVEFVAAVEAGFIQIKAVAVLHDELADAQEAGAGAGFVAEFGLDLVPGLRKLLVAVELIAGDVGHDLFMGHAEAEVCAFAILEAKHSVAHDGPAAGLAPEVGGMDGGEEEFLADAVHFFADDGDDAVDGALA